MLELTIYDSADVQSTIIKPSIKEYAERQYSLIKQYAVNTIEDLLKTKTKICLIDYEIFLEHSEVLKEWKKNNKTIFIFVTDDYFQMIKAVREDPTNFFLLKPIETDFLWALLDYIRTKIKSNIIVIKIPGGEEIIKVNKLNYINIAGRNMRFHMICKREIDSQSLRRSFAKEIEPMLKHKELYFIAPSLLVNLENIKALYKDYMVFENEDKAYFPKTKFEELNRVWKEYHLQE